MMSWQHPNVKYHYSDMETQAVIDDSFPGPVNYVESSWCISANTNYLASLSRATDTEMLVQIYHSKFGGANAETTAQNCIEVAKLEDFEQGFLQVIGSSFFTSRDLLCVAHRYRSAKMLVASYKCNPLDKDAELQLKQYSHQDCLEIPDLLGGHAHPNSIRSKTTMRVQPLSKPSFLEIKKQIYLIQADGVTSSWAVWQLHNRRFQPVGRKGTVQLPNRQNLGGWSVEAFGRHARPSGWAACLIRDAGIEQNRQYSLCRLVFKR